MSTPAYSERTKTEYETWDALVAAEANGWVAVTIITRGGDTWPWVSGPYPTKREGDNARNRMRTRFKREQRERGIPETTASFYVRPAWKDAS